MLNQEKKRTVKMDSTCYFQFIIIFLVISLIFNFFISKKSQTKAFISTVAIWMGFIAIMVGWIFKLPNKETIPNSGFFTNSLSWLMGSLILLVSGLVHKFSLNFLNGDEKFDRYFFCLQGITISTLCLAASDNMILFILFWLISNCFLSILMIHKFRWKAAKAAGFLAIRNFFIGGLFLSVSFALLYSCSNHLSISKIAQSNFQMPNFTYRFSLVCLVLAAFSQSGIWPFHRWLISSLNSPTPISSLMHAGLVNGGGFLLIKFAPLLINEDKFLMGIFLFGFLSSSVGTIWKLMQSDVKRMLASSTMGQMGFMFMQCGLGLFPSALAHLINHGLFKSYLFLKVGSTPKEKHLKKKHSPSFQIFILSIICGIFGSFGFAVASKKTLLIQDANLILFIFSAITAIQIATVTLKRHISFPALVYTCGICFISGVLHGASVIFIESVLSPIDLCCPQKLNSLHFLIMLVFVGLWLVINFQKYPLKRHFLRFYPALYVYLLNSSQPHPNTITALRNDYKY